VFEESTEGTPQGGNLSPLLANIYLNHLDRRMGEYGHLLLRYADDFIIFCKFEWEAQDALKRAKEILERELKLKLSPEKTKIVLGNVTGVEFLGFHFNGRWKEPRDKAVKKFKSEIKQRTKRQQPISLGTLIKLLNPKIRGWRNYFQGCNKKRRLKELDEYIMGRVRCFVAKSRSNPVLWYTFPKSEFAQMGLIFLYRSIYE